MTAVEQQQQQQNTSFMDATFNSHSITMQQPEQAKKIHVYMNGHEHYPGRGFVVNRRHISDFDGFLNMVTGGLKPPFGAVRNIYTPTCGHRVHDLHEINNNMVIVAGGVERFRRLQYQEITAPSKKPGRPRNASLIRPVYHNTRMNVPARWKQLTKDPCCINVYANGDNNGKATKMLLIPRMMKHWDLVLQEVTEKISFRTGQAARRLCTLNGEMVHDSDQLQNGGYYVAVGYERFKRCPYGERAQHLAMNHSPRRPHVLPPIKPRKPRTVNSKPTDQSYAQKYAQKKQLEEQKYPQTTPGVGRQPHGGRKLRPIKTTAPPSSESESVFHAKPVKVKRSGASGRLTQVAPQSDHEDDVFHAKGDKVRAEEVAEDEDTKVDLPIDQVPADTVEDEEILDVPVKTEEEDVQRTQMERSPTPDANKDHLIQNEPEPIQTPSSPTRAEQQPSPEADFRSDESPRPNSSAVPAREVDNQEEKQTFGSKDEAATHIQAQYRGYRVRKDLENKKKGEDTTVEETADKSGGEMIEKADVPDQEAEEEASIPQNLPLLAAPENEESPVETKPEHSGSSSRTEDQQADPDQEQSPGEGSEEQQPTTPVRTPLVEEKPSESPQKDEDVPEPETEPKVVSDDDKDDQVTGKSSEEEKTEETQDDSQIPEPDKIENENDPSPLVNDLPETVTATGDASEVNEPVFDLASGQMIPGPGPAPDKSNENEEHVTNLSERDAGDGDDAMNENEPMNQSQAAAEHDVSPNVAAEEDRADSQQKESEGISESKESSPARFVSTRPASQTSSVGEEQPVITDKPSQEEQPLPNGQPVALVEGNA